MADAFRDGSPLDLAGVGLSLTGHDGLLTMDALRAGDVPASRSPVCPLPSPATPAADVAPAGVAPPAPEPSVPRLIFAALAAIAWTVGRRLKR